MRPIGEPNSATLNVDKDSPTSHVELFYSNTGDEVKIDEGETNSSIVRVFNCLYISRSQDENKSIVYIRNRKKSSQKGFPSENISPPSELLRQRMGKSGDLPSSVSRLPHGREGLSSEVGNSQTPDDIL